MDDNKPPMSDRSVVMDIVCLRKFSHNYDTPTRGLPCKRYCFSILHLSRYYTVSMNMKGFLENINTFLKMTSFQNVNS